MNRIWFSRYKTISGIRGLPSAPGACGRQVASGHMEGAAEARRLVDERHHRTAGGGLDGARQPGRTSADDEPVVRPFAVRMVRVE